MSIMLAFLPIYAPQLSTSCQILKLDTPTPYFLKCTNTIRFHTYVSYSERPAPAGGVGEARASKPSPSADDGAQQAQLSAASHQQPPAA